MIKNMIQCLKLNDALRIGIARRTFFDLKDKLKSKKSFSVKKKTLELVQGSEHSI